MLFPGVDSNRNFDANFGGVGSSSSPCSETYGGPYAFSEAESRAMRDILLTIQNRAKAVVSIHNNAQVWISPYGYTTELPADYGEMVLSTRDYWLNSFSGSLYRCLGFL